MVYTGQPSKGCATCRKRRIKCDEKVPECGGCLRVDKKCPGYRNHFDLAWRDQTIVAKKGVERGKAKRKAAREQRELELETERDRGRGGSSGSTTERRQPKDDEMSIISMAPPVHAPVPRYYDSSSTTSSSPGPSISPTSETSSSRGTPQTPHLTLELSNASLPIDPYQTLSRPIPEEQALCFFFNNYVLPIRDPIARKGFLEYLGPIYSRSDPQSPVQMSIMAVATCMMSSRLGELADTPLSRSFYVQAVSRIKDRVSKQKNCANDELIVSVMLLQLYEVSLLERTEKYVLIEDVVKASVGHLMKRTTNPHPHLDGALAMIRHRGPWNFTDYISRSVLMYIRGLLIDQAFRELTSVPPDVETWADFVPENELLPTFRFDSINLALANLRAYAQFLTQTQLSKTQAAQIQQVLKDGLMIDYQLLQWSNSVPESWIPIRITREHYISPTLQLYQDYCDVYRTIFLASTWNKLRLSQIEVKQLFLSCLSKLPTTPANLARRQSHEQGIQQLADDICASVPFYLGDRMKPGRTGDLGINYPRAPGKPPVLDHYQTGPVMGGWALLQPLGTLMKMNIKLRDGQRGWLAGQMARTARIYNIVQMPKK